MEIANRIETARIRRNLEQIDASFWLGHDENKNNQWTRNTSSLVIGSQTHGDWKAERNNLSIEAKNWFGNC